MSERLTVDSALRKVAASGDEIYGVMLEHGSMQHGFYKPDREDPQSPHEQDEIYVVQSGSGYFVLDEMRQPFESGEALFVAAGQQHRFEDFTPDFAAWVIFYGPVGGENNDA